jgi:hypothetical protein
MSRRSQPGPLSAGWRLVWHTHPVLWWIYAVNLTIGLFSAIGFATRVGHVLNHSLAAQHLYHSFDLAYVLELAINPDAQLASRPTSSFTFAALFVLFMLFVLGGVLDTYARNRSLVPGEFFQGCGGFFWRFVRLLLWLGVVLLPLAALAIGLNRWSDYLSEYSSHEKLGFWVLAAGFTMILLLLMAVRLWFDMAQVRTVVEDERSVTRALGRAFTLTYRNFAPLFSMYLAITLVAWAGTALALYFWAKFVPSEGTLLAFLTAQFIAWLWIVSRLWQRATKVIWYQRQRPSPALPLVQEAIGQAEPEIPTLAPEHPPGS